MKQVIFLICTIAMVFSEPPPECRPPNFPAASFEECCQLNYDLLPRDKLLKCDAAFPMPSGPPSGPPPPPGPKPCCMSECVLKELNIFTDGKIDKTVAAAMLMNATSSDPKMKPIIEAGVNFCMEKADKLKEEFSKLPPAPGATCSFIPGIFVGCLYGQIYKACPTIADKAECKSLSDFAKKCDWVPPIAMKMKKM